MIASRAASIVAVICAGTLTSTANMRERRRSCLRSAGSTASILISARRAASDRLDAAPGLSEACAEHQRLELLAVEHQRRQVEALAQGIAHAGLALDGDARQHEVADVTIDRALRDFQPLGERAGGGEAPAAQQFDELEQPVGAAHERLRSSQRRDSLGHPGLCHFVRSFRRAGLHGAQNRQALLTAYCQ